MFHFIFRKKQLFSFTYPCPRKLREIMKISMIEREPTHKIKDIWSQYHESRIANIATVLEKDKYLHLINKANSAPMFLLPVFRKGGHFKVITQWQSNCFLATYMQDFKRQKTNAQPYAVFTLFTQLLYSKGIVLVRGDIINSALIRTQAEKLWEFIESSYTEEHKFEQIDHFNHNNQLFDEKQYNSHYGI